MKYLLTILIVLMLAVAANAQTDVTLGWDYTVADEADITEFLLYYADVPDPAAWVLIQMDTILPALRTVDLEIAGTQDICFMLRAARDAVLSANSNSACWTVPPPPPPDPNPARNLWVN